MYEVHTGDIVRVYAEDEGDMWDKVASGDYEFVETYSTILFVGADVQTQNK